MSITKQLNIVTIYFVSFLFLSLFVGFISKTSPAHALSCLNPIEMIDDYVMDERVSIAYITAGELETTGAEHMQAVSVDKNLKGTTDTTVTFIYDDTWQYLCAGQPAAVGTKVVYVTTNGTVTQVIDIDSSLYDALMNALGETPENPTLTPPEAEETKRTLMQRVVELLQRVMSLLTIEPTQPINGPEPTPTVEAIIGMVTAQAEAYTTDNNILFRVVEIDGEPQPITEDYRPGRINASVENGVVVNYTVEGEANTTENARPHEQIIGMTQDDAEAYTTKKDILFRIGKIDDEFLPLTMDYRPGRITAEIKNGVIVDYSIE